MGPMLDLRTSGGQMLELRTFGGLSIKDHGAPITGAATQRKTLALLALLAAAGKNGLSRDKLIAYLWPESDAEHGRNLLNQACYALRRDLHDREVLLGASELRLNQDVLASDVQAFEDALQRGDTEAAVRAYAGPFLDGFFISAAPEFERWLDAERARLKQCACQALEALATAAAARGEHTASVAWWRRLAALDPLNARIARALMEALAATGDRAGALQHARVHAALLRQELDAAPDPAVTEFVRRLREAPRERAPIAAAREVGAADRVLPAAPPAEPSSVGVASPAVDGVVPDARPVELPGAAVAAAPRSRRAFQVARWPAVATVLTAVVGGVLYSHLKTDAALDPDLVAVAPFDILAPNVDLWREGLVDVLSRNLDGAGPLRTVAPTVVIRRWRGRADNVSAADLGRRTGAQLVVFGALLGAGRDSIRLSATLFDIRSARVLAEIEYRDAGDHMDRLTDSLTVAVLRELGRTRPIGAVRLASLGSTSLPAIKAFLRGEQFYRRDAADSALEYYRRAVALDSTFALALRRMPLALWTLGADESLVHALMLRVGARNHGLAPRESLLVTIDSLWGALETGEAEPWPLLHRLSTTLDQAVRRYPDDPEVWVYRGELGFHWGSYGQPTITPQQALEALDRSISLDSGFAAYYHAIALALELRGSAEARRYILAYLALHPGPPVAPALDLLDGLLDPNRAMSSEVTRLLDTLSGDALWHAGLTVMRWDDSAEMQLRVARALAVARHGFRYTDSSVTNWVFALPLAYRGHLREAYANLRLDGGLISDVTFAELARLGGVPRDSAIAVFGRWLRSSDFAAAHAVRWSGEVMEGALGLWAETGDTASIQELARRIDSGIRLATNPGGKSFLRYGAAAAQAFLALARHDTSDALRRLAAAPDSLCPHCFLGHLAHAHLLSAKGQDRDAARLLDQRVPGPDDLSPSEVAWTLERARVNERLGNRDKAVQNYAFVARVWANADSSLQPLVAEARAALARLRGEPRPQALVGR